MPQQTSKNNSVWWLWVALVLMALLLVALAVVMPWWQRRHAPSQPPGSPSTTQAPPAVSRGHAYGGFPRSVAPGTEVTVLTNTGYVAGYSESRKNPLWVCYRLFALKEKVTLPRPAHFSVDGRTIARVRPTDYNNSDFDRGHLAPNDAIGDCYGPEAQLETFLMSNVIPQKPSFNRGIWEELEKHVFYDLAHRFEEIWVTTGPVFVAPVETLRGGVAIPARCYKIVVRVDHGRPEMISWDLPQDASGRDATSYLTSVGKIEEATGLEFFPEVLLPDAQRMKSAKP